ncbi:FK506-binding protein-like [Scleropages formosus]|uniref:FK506-binding protein-like n=2 Tax=Scleropages formosus TaxID=113540 RepID=A0A0P7TKM1_SCLFO|nr:FK506-binding protein-like isoform X2 [Scleropages formosus]XP_018580970.1 FK506-binding protein-like isoform X2 [Scleropages formosus]KPP61446.1 FK506-binding protein-like [Scleropages formosus]
MKTVHQEEKGDIPISSDVTSWVSVCPSGLLEVVRRRTQERGRGDQCPKMGSICRVRVQPKTDNSDVQKSVCVVESDTVADTQGAIQTPSYPRSQTSLLQIPVSQWVSLRMGGGQCDVVETCIEGMKAGESCELSVSTLKGSSIHESGRTQLGACCALGQVEAEKQNAQVQELTGKGELLENTQNPSDPQVFLLELHSFTPGKESWEMSPGEKWTWVKNYRECGGVRFHAGDVWGAADCYSRALKLLFTLKDEKKGKVEERKRGMERIAEEERVTEEESDTNGESRIDLDGQRTKDEEKKEKLQEKGAELPVNSPANSEKVAQLWPVQECIPSEEEYKTFRSELHSNLSLCQLRLGLPERARHSGKRATELDPNSPKAWYRLGRACVQVGELGMARSAFKKVLELQPGSQSALKALREVGAREKEMDSKLGQRLSKMFS